MFTALNSTAAAIAGKTSGYGSLGTELQTGAVALRVEARDYMSCFKSPVTGLHDTRSDLGLSLGVAYHRQ